MNFLVEYNRLHVLVLVFKKYISKVIIVDINNIQSNTHISIKFNFIYIFIEFLRDSLLFSLDCLQDFTVVDYLSRVFRFELYYNLYSYFYNFRFFIKSYLMFNINVFDNGIQSISTLYFSAGWLEREVYDMFGIFFFDHIDLRRILTDYGFFGFPLRKDFPLSGFKEIRYDDTIKLIVFDSIKLSQEFRVFNKF